MSRFYRRLCGPSAKLATEPLCEAWGPAFDTEGQDPVIHFLVAAVGWTGGGNAGSARVMGPQ
jgi:hypothetical protein